MDSGAKGCLGVFVAMLAIWGIGSMGHNSASVSDATDSSNPTEAAIERELDAQAETHELESGDGNDWTYNASSNSLRSTPSYSNPRWPTTNPQLLAIPEGDRWYNARAKVGTYCTVAGPVKSVYKANESNGQPLFIDIGEAYPGSDRVTLVIWDYCLSDFSQMASEVDRALSQGGDPWLSVTGYLSDYYGSMQFNVDDGAVEYTWWT